MRISKRFKLGRSQFELDFVDIDPGRDYPLFLDPHFLGIRTDHWSLDATRSLRNFFEFFIGLLRAGNEAEARLLFDHLHEPNETCLGLSRRRPRGNGVGPDDAERIFESLKESKAVKTGILEDLEDCRIFVRGIDKDKRTKRRT
jgi:hypothetical protein